MVPTADIPQRRAVSRVTATESLKVRHVHTCAREGNTRVNTSVSSAGSWFAALQISSERTSLGGNGQGFLQSSPAVHTGKLKSTELQRSSELALPFQPGPHALQDGRCITMGGQGLLHPPSSFLQCPLRRNFSLLLYQLLGVTEKYSRGSPVLFLPLLETRLPSRITFSTNFSWYLKYLFVVYCGCFPCGWYKSKDTISWVQRYRKLSLQSVSGLEPKLSHMRLGHPKCWLNRCPITLVHFSLLLRR